MLVLGYPLILRLYIGCRVAFDAKVGIKKEKNLKARVKCDEMSRVLYAEMLWFGYFLVV